MRKLASIVLAVALILCLSACAVTGSPSPSSGGSASDTPPSSTVEAPAPTASSVIQLDKTIALDNLTFTAMEIERSEGDSFAAPNEGMVFVGVKFTIENTSSEEKAIPTLMIFENYADDLKCLYATAAVSVYGNILGGSLAASKKMVGYHVVEVPADAKTLTLEFTDTMKYVAGDTEEFFLFDIPQG